MEIEKLSWFPLRLCVGVPGLGVIGATLSLAKCA